MVISRKIKYPRSIKKRLPTAFLFISFACGIPTIIAADSHTSAGEKPGKGDPLRPCVNKVLSDLHLGNGFDPSQLDDTHEFIARRLDKSDFLLQSLLRIVYAHAAELPPAELARIKKTLVNFKYWMDRPGRDSMCYWSENHQILFAAAEYLAGQYYPDSVFSNTGKTGAEHCKLSRNRIMIWLEQRWRHGFSEWYSNVYYVEDIAALANLIDFARDDEIVCKATIVMDLLLHDLATQSHRGVFISTSGRLYERHKKSNRGNSMRTVSEHIWGKNAFGYRPWPRHNGLELNFVLSRKYKVPEAIKAIGMNAGPCVIKASNGLDIDELRDHGLWGQDDRQIMMQWGMEAFSNHAVVENTMAYVKRNKLFSNKFLRGFKMFDASPLNKNRMLEKISRTMRPLSDGAAIQRANTYTYRTPDFMIATAQAYHPGEFSSQHHIWTATLSEKVSLFTTHPAKSVTFAGVRSKSPGYWVGNGRLPHSVQHENIVLNLYRIPKRAAFLEEKVYDFTHAYFPEDILEEVSLEGQYAFARHRNTLVAFIGRHPMSYAAGSRDDLIQPGRKGEISYWIFEASSLEQEGGMEAFKARIRNNAADYAGGTLQYESGGTALKIAYGGEFLVNGAVVDTQYKRFDSPYASCDRNPRTIEIAYGGHLLELDFHACTRKSR